MYDPAVCSMSSGDLVGLATLYAVLEHAADGIVTVSESGELITYNRAAEKMFQYTRAEVKSRGVELLMPATDRQHHQQHVVNYLQGGRARIIGTGRQVKCQRKDGIVFRADLSISEAVVDDRRVFTAIFRDLSERDALADQVHSLGADLSHSEQELDTILKFAPIGIVTMTATGRISTVNRALQRMTGYTPDDLLQKNAIQFVHTDEQGQIEHTFRALIASGDGYSSSTHKIRRADGSYLPARTYNASLPVEGGKPSILITMLQDLSYQYAQEEQLKVQRERLAHVAQLTQLGEMAAGIAHELNQPLSAIANYASAGARLMAKKSTDHASVHEALKRIAEQADRAGSIIRKTRSLTRRHETVKHVFNVSETISGLLPMLAIDTRSSSIAVNTRLEAQQSIRADEVQIEQVILNFFRNAVDAVRKLPEARRVIFIRTRDEGDQVVTEVEDLGDGISKALQASLFDPFVTSKTKGLGMGLSISRSIVMLHDGDIGTRQLPEGGCVFWFSIPAVGDVTGVQS